MKHLIKDKEEIKKRITICKECDEFISLVKTCGVCKCFMPAKVAITWTVCPLGKWSEVNSTEQPIAKQ
jgi:hypothetical protein